MFGFSGSYVVRELLRAGEQVIATDQAAVLENPLQREIVRQIGVDLHDPNLKVVPADLLDPATLKPLFQWPLTRVFHTASLYDYSAPLERLRRINVEGTRNLLDLALTAGLERFVHWSTCGVFGKPYTASCGRRVNVPFTEASSSPKTTPDDRTEPEGTHLVNAYSVTKWAQEKMMWRAYREHGLPLTVIRPAPIYGPGSSYGHGGIILAVAQGFLPAIPLDAKNHITASVHVEDVARFACFIAEQEISVGEDYNVVDNSVVSYFDFLKYIALLTGRSMVEIPLLKLRWLRPIFIGAAHTWAWLERTLDVPRVRVFEVQSAPYISSSYWLSNRKSLATGFAYAYPDVREGLKDTVVWLRDMGWLTDRNMLQRVNIGGGKSPL